MHVGLTMIPEEPSFDFTTIDSVNTGYTNGMEFGGLYDAQVYAVTTLPQGPAVDIPTFAMLHGKSSNVVGPCPSPDDRTKDETVVVDTIPAAKFNMPVPIETPSEDVTVDVSDAALALFANHSSPYLSASPTLGPEDRILGGMGLEKAFSRLELIVDDGRNDTAEISLAVLERFERLCSRCDAISLSVANCTSHLS